MPVNFTLSSSVIPRDFFARTGDPMRYDAKADLEFLLDTGVGLALVYGDRDYRCNCAFYLSFLPPSLRVIRRAERKGC